MVLRERPEEVAPVVDRPAQAVEEDERRAASHLRDAVASAVDLDVAKGAFAKQTLAKRREPRRRGDLDRGRGAATYDPGESHPEGFHAENVSATAGPGKSPVSRSMTRDMSAPGAAIR